MGRGGVSHLLHAMKLALMIPCMAPSDLLMILQYYVYFLLIILSMHALDEFRDHSQVMGIGL